MYVQNSLFNEFYLRLLIKLKNWALARSFLPNVAHVYYGYYKNNFRIIKTTYWVLARPFQPNVVHVYYVY